MAEDVSINLGIATKGVEKSLSSLKGQILKVGAALATAFAGKKIIDAAVAQEKAVNALNQSLLRSGEFSKEASQDLQQFASDLQAVSTIGDETSLELLALAKSFGVSNDEAKKLVTTAVDASVALGVDSRTALEQLGGTLSGVEGRLAKFVPEVKELSESALKSGAAIDIFAEKFKGAATGELNTFDGALTQTLNIIGDFAEELGFFITKSPLVIEAIKAVGRGFSEAIKFLQNTAPFIRDILADISGILIEGFGFVIRNILPPLIELFLVLLKVSNEVGNAILGLLKTFTGFEFVRDLINGVYRAVLALADVILEKLLGAFKAVARAAGIDVSRITAGVDKLRDGIEDIAGNDAAKSLESLIGKTIDLREEAVTFVQSTLESIKEGAENLDFKQVAKKITEGLRGRISIDPITNQKNLEKTFVNIAKKWGQTAAKTIAQNIGQASAALGKGLVDIISKGTQQTSATQANIRTLQEQLSNTTDQGERERIENEILKAEKDLIKIQRDAAQEFTSEIGGFVADVFLPGAGQFVKLFLDLAKDPEAFRAFVEGFIENLPEIIDALAEALPEIFEIVAENLDKILIAISLAAIRLVEASFKGLGRAIAVIANNIGTEISGFIQSAGDSFVRRIGSGANEFINKIVEGAKDVAKSVTGGVTIGGTLGQAGESIKGALGFAEGGIVPQGFPNDTGLARVSSGEIILNEPQQKNLFRMLNNGGAAGGQMITVNLVMNEDVLARQILEINRDNLRTA